jgi:hypothetical protein
MFESTSNLIFETSKISDSTSQIIKNNLIMMNYNPHVEVYEDIVIFGFNGLNLQVRKTLNLYLDLYLFKSYNSYVSWECVYEDNFQIKTGIELIISKLVKDL